jgi:hypothetical protein
MTYAPVYELALRFGPRLLNLSADSLDPMAVLALRAQASPQERVPADVLAAQAKVDRSAQTRRLDAEVARLRQFQDVDPLTVEQFGTPWQEAA